MWVEEYTYEPFFGLGQKNEWTKNETARLGVLRGFAWESLWKLPNTGFYCIYLYFPFPFCFYFYSIFILSSICIVLPGKT